MTEELHELLQEYCFGGKPDDNIKEISRRLKERDKQKQEIADLNKELSEVWSLYLNE